MAEMTPGLESLAEDLDDFRALVIEFIGYAEGLVKDRRGDPELLDATRKEIEDEVDKLGQQLSPPRTCRCDGKMGRLGHRRFYGGQQRQLASRLVEERPSHARRLEGLG